MPGVPHYITQRGNNQQEVFFVEGDGREYLRLLKEAGETYGLTVQGYCLMRNHVHIVGTPEREESLAKAIGRTHFGYTQYINKHHGRVGHLWQNRFYSCPMDRDHYWNALRYVERNPVRAGMVKGAWEYRWSSAAAHVGQRDGSRLLDLATWRREVPKAEWEATLVAPEDDDMLETLRSRTMTGRPLGSDGIVKELEVKLGRRVGARPVGRPRK